MSTWMGSSKEGAMLDIPGRLTVLEKCQDACCERRVEMASESMDMI